MYNKNDNTMMKAQTEVKAETKTRYVITNDGIRMRYDEYMEMIKNER